jgi:hypothetical protein
MDYLSEIPQNCTLIRATRLTLLIRNDFKEKLLKQGILEPDRLITRAVNEGAAYTGRGLLPTVLICEEAGERMVAKQSLRGGLVRFINRDLFLNGDRPFEEMIANTKILSVGIKTTEILAAAKLKVLGPFYRNYLFSKEIPESIDLSGLFNSLKKRSPQERFKKKKRIIKALAHSIFKMHRQGIYHSDLHLKNILVRQNVVSSEPDIYIIDFDKVRLHKNLSPREKIENLLRFNRSLEKYKFMGGDITRTDQARFFKYYFKYEPQLYERFGLYYKKYHRFVKLRKLKWALLG